MTSIARSCVSLRPHRSNRPTPTLDDWWALRYELPERMKEAVERAGGAMPTPQREILFPAGVPKAK